jgi:hypothetical protein
MTERPTQNLASKFASMSLLVLALPLALMGCGAEQPTQTIDQPRPASASDRAETSSSRPDPDIPFVAPGPARVDDAKQGQALAANRREATPVDPRGMGQRYPARMEPITWDYGRCTNARTLIPPPLDGWGLLNDTSVGEWLITDDNASIVLTRAGAPHDPDTLGRAAGDGATSIYISSGTPTTKAMQDMFNNEQLRSAFFEPGPYNYPVRKGVAGERHQEVLLGPYRVLIGSDDSDGEYFRQIIRCAISNDLIATGVNPSILRKTP